MVGDWDPRRIESLRDGVFAYSLFMARAAQPLGRARGSGHYISRYRSSTEGFYAFELLGGCRDCRAVWLHCAPANTNNTAGAATKR